MAIRAASGLSTSRRPTRTYRSLWGILPLFPDVKARARVEVSQVIEQNGMLPWAVPEVEPAAVAALFVDENSGDVIAAQQLDKRDDPGLPFDEWVTSDRGSRPHRTST